MSTNFDQFKDNLLLNWNRLEQYEEDIAVNHAVYYDAHPSYQAFLKCALQFFNEDNEDWKKFGSGYMLGIHSDNINDSTCKDCEGYGNNMALINYGLVSIEENKDMWLQKSKISSLDVLQILGWLMQINMLFIIALIPIDSIITNQ